MRSVQFLLRKYCTNYSKLIYTLHLGWIEGSEQRSFEGCNYGDKGSPLLLEIDRGVNTHINLI